MTAPRRTARLEHRLTQPNASLTDLHAAIPLVLEHGLAALAVNPWLVRPAARSLARSPVSVATVIGFPHGAQAAAVKAFEASMALEHGASQLDFVLNAGALVSGDDEAVLNDMLAVVEMAQSALATCGVIVPVGLLGEELVRRACRLAARAGVDHVTTSIGDEPAEATVEWVRRLRRVGDEELPVKAAGSFTDVAQVASAIAAGAVCISTVFGPELAAAASALLAETAPARTEPTLADVGAAAG